MNLEHSRLAEVVLEPEGIKALLGLPKDPRGLVIFAHGSGSGRFSPRNNEVARGLHEAGLATLLLDLLRLDEEHDRRNVFDIELLASRLAFAASWARQQPDLAQLPIGYFGASTGGGAALVAAASDPTIGAVVSRGGRPDLAGDALPRVKAPTMLIVGGADTEVLALNREAAARMSCPVEILIVPGATHLFEEPGALESVVEHAQKWFLDHLATRPRQGLARALRFTNRTDAGRQLARALLTYQSQNPVIVALPRGGVPVAFEVAKALDAPLDIAFVRKIGAPGYAELGLGAVVDGGEPEVVLNDDVMQALGPSPEYVEAETQRQLAEIERRRQLYQVEPINLAGRTVIVVDDGIATGGTIQAVLRAIRKRDPSCVIAAVPVAAAETIKALAPDADDIVCLSAPADFRAVGLYYDDFRQTSDDEVIDLMRRASARPTHQHSDMASGVG